MQTLRQETEQSYRELCPFTGLPYSTFMRWQGRIARGKEVVRLPGLRPPVLSMEEEKDLAQAIARLHHGRVRTAGTGALHRLWKGRISRRDLHRRVSEYRREMQGKKRREMTRIRYLMPGAIWTMDDMGTCRRGKIHHVRDSASRYDLTLMAASRLPGKEVARNLEELIVLHGPPLVVKRDNGSNLNAEEVNEVLDRHAIIPLNSPPHYPRYNGQIERGQGEVREELNAFPEGVPIVSPEGKVRLSMVKESLAHRRRPCLGGQTAAEAFLAGRERMFWYNYDRRKAALESIEMTRAEIVHQEGTQTERAAAGAWRRAVETWLLQEGVIAIEKRGSVTPFPSFSVS